MWSTQGKHFRAFAFPVLCQQHVYLYTDDSTIIFSYKDPEIISQKLGKELESCSNWLVDNKLSLHLAEQNALSLVRNIN
jgi:hypothetical protein